MPIYEYVCQECGQEFEHFWPSLAKAERASAEGASLPCPRCESSHTKRVVSQVSVLGGLGGLTPNEKSAANAQAEREAAVTPKAQIDQLQANRAKKRREQS